MGQLSFLAQCNKPKRKSKIKISGRSSSVMSLLFERSSHVSAYDFCNFLYTFPKTPILVTNLILCFFANM
jgi:hypothetical protein